MKNPHLNQQSTTTANQKSDKTSIRPKITHHPDRLNTAHNTEHTSSKHTHHYYKRLRRNKPKEADDKDPQSNGKARRHLQTRLKPIRSSWLHHRHGQRDPDNASNLTKNEPNQPQLYHAQKPTPSVRSSNINHYGPSLLTYRRYITRKESLWRPSHSSAETAGRKRPQI
ncbi:hypothetical protein Bca4012_066093 [Brassica carinata]